MKVRTKILLVGISLAAVIILSGVSGRQYHSHRLAALVAECEATDVQSPEHPLSSYGVEMEVPRDSHGHHLCDPVLLNSWNSPHGLLGLSDLQQDIRKADFDAKYFMSGFPAVAGSLALLFAFPWLWYLLLLLLWEIRHKTGGSLPPE